jgi:hypothetical protein
MQASFTTSIAARRGVAVRTQVRLITFGDGRNLAGMLVHWPSLNANINSKRIRALAESSMMLNWLLSKLACVVAST